METLQRHQTIAPHCNGTLRLTGLIPSPYTKELNGIGPVRNTKLFLTYMKAIAGLDYAVSGGAQYVGVAFFDGNTFVDAQNIPFDMADATDAAGLISAAESAINTYATGQSYSLTEGIFWTYAKAPVALGNAPQAAIANAPADAVTNYNVVTTLLGSLTSAVNDANTKQNAIATKLNTLLAELRTLGLIST